MKIVLSALLLFFVSVTQGQTFHVQGKITTKSGVVKNAVVMFTSQVDKTTHYSATTDSLGNYKIDIVTGVNSRDTKPPSGFILEQNYPNPFTSTTSIPYELHKPSEICLQIYNMLGQQVKTVIAGIQDNGMHTLTWNGTDDRNTKVAPGVYFFKVRAGGEVKTGKMVYGMSSRPYMTIGQPGFSPGYLRKNATDLRSQNGLPVFTVKVLNSLSTLPLIIEKEFPAIVLGDNTDLNYSVNDDQSQYVLCYMKVENNNWEIFVNNLAGTCPKNISNSPFEDSSPAWSPDGKYIAYTHFNSYGTSILLYDIERDTLIGIDSSITHNSSRPKWLPNSQKLVYDYHEIGKPYYTYIVDRDGRNNRKLFDGQGYVAFYPDGTNYIYKTISNFDSTDFIVHRSNLDSTSDTPVLDLRTLTSNSSHTHARLYDFHPVKNELLLLLPDSSNLTGIIMTYNIESKKADTLAIEEPGWLWDKPMYSHDFSKILVREYNTSNSGDKLSIIADGKKTELLSVQGPVEGLDFNPFTFSGDDRSIAYSTSTLIPGEYVSWISYVHIINLATNHITNIDRGTCPQWGTIKNK